MFGVKKGTCKNLHGYVHIVRGIFKGYVQGVRAGGTCNPSGTHNPSDKRGSVRGVRAGGTCRVYVQGVRAIVPEEKFPEEIIPGTNECSVLVVGLVTKFWYWH